MQTRPLGRSGLVTAPLAFGGNVFGWTADEATSFALLDAFVAGLPTRDAPITEPWTAPLWHNPLYFLVAIACLAGEWGLRRVNGLA